MSSHIPFKIQVQIIQRLPVLSLIRFKSVCKTWKSMIESSEFRVHPTQPQHLMVRYKETEEIKYVSIVDSDDTFTQQKFALTTPPLLQLVDAIRIIDSSCGLLCLKGFFFQEPDNSTTDMAVLWNPSIRKSIAVAVDVPKREHYCHNYLLSFGVCPYTMDPKLVKVTNCDYETPNRVMVFTLSSGEWRCLSSNQHPPRTIHLGYCQTTIGQFIYWLADEMVNENGGWHNLIMSFDLCTDEFREVHLPDRLREAFLSISRLRESLILLDYNRNSTTDKKVCDVWMMKHGDPKEFTKLITIKPPNASIEQTLGFRMGFRKSGEPILEMQDDVHGGASALAIYEPSLEQIKDLGICRIDDSFCMSYYTESLVLLNHDDGGII